MDNLAVSMQGITKIFNGVKANDNVDFNLRKGSIHGLLGENGAGKTTLISCMVYISRRPVIFILTAAKKKFHHR